MIADSDIIVVGGGPCGSFAALNLAKLGLDVTVIEEHSEIGFPAHCAGHLSIAGLTCLGLFPLTSDIIENVFYGVTFYSSRGRAFSIDFDLPVTCAVNRSLFDRYIAELARKEGANYCLSSRVESLIIGSGSVKGVVAGIQGRREEIRTKIVVDAEGVTSRLLMQAGLRPVNRLRIVKGLEAEFENVENTDLGKVEVYLGREYAPNFYTWIIPKPGGRAKVGVGAEYGDPRRFLKKLIFEHPVASGKLKKARMLSIAFHPITLGGRVSAACTNGLLAVGDVAGQVKPTTGGGVIFGLNCARIAAEVAKAALDSDDYSVKSLYIYQRRLEEQFGFDERMMLVMRDILNSLSDQQIESLIEFCKRFKLNKALRNVKDIDFQGQSFLKMLRNPRIIAALGYFAYILLRANFMNAQETTTAWSGKRHA